MILSYLGSMTCQHCCGAESIFDKKSAQRDFKRYKRKGPNKTTRTLLAEINKHAVNGWTLLDIGGGVGVIQHELLKKGLKSTTDVDASISYQEKAKQIANENDTIDQMCFIHGDFIDRAGTLEPHDIVTLERVVCCYPDIEKLIELSTEKSQHIYAIVYPAENMFSKALIKLSHLYFWIKKNPFRTFVHSEKLMHSLIEKQGFQLLSRKGIFFWKVAVYARVG